MGKTRIEWGSMPVEVEGTTWFDSCKYDEVIEDALFADTAFATVGVTNASSDRFLDVPISADGFGDACSSVEEK